MHLVHGVVQARRHIVFEFQDAKHGRYLRAAESHQLALLVCVFIGPPHFQEVAQVGIGDLFELAWRDVEALTHPHPRYAPLLIGIEPDLLREAALEYERRA
ncbi:MAG: hypothetical protein M5U29_07350 [Anaerolineae bacterium]|nr:hypothetical protein [Anaerolineae bacterium]